MKIQDNVFRLHKSGGNSATLLPHDIDETADPRYYGYVSADGGWIIQRYNEGTGTLRYATGTKNYSTNWTNKASQTYDYINEVL